jgi:dUTP pyrophosphatase
MPRKFEMISTYLVGSINLPVRKTEFSAGYDFESAETVIINVGETKIVKTGVKAYMNPNEYLSLSLRSGIASQHSLILVNSPGIIDSDYADNKDNEGEIMFAIYNGGKYAYKIEKGQRIGQGIFTAFLTVDDEATVTEKRSGGLGSTNKK